MDLNQSHVKHKKSIHKGLLNSIEYSLPFFISDFVILLLSPFFSFFLRSSNVELFVEYLPSILYITFISVPLRISAFLLFKNYRKDNLNLKYQFIGIFFIMTFSSIIIYLSMLIMLDFEIIELFSKSVVVLDAIISSGFILLSRLGFIVFEHKPENNKNFSTNLIIKIKEIFKNISQYSNIIMFCLVLIYGVIYLLIGGVIPVNSGYGWDGQFYRDIVKNFDLSLFSSKTLNIYRIQRIFPSGVLSIFLKTFQFPLSDSSILFGFQIFTLISLLLSVVTYNGIINELKINLLYQWLGFFGLFFNYAVLKQFFYYPVLTDQFAFLLGLLLFYFYIKNNLLGLIIITLIGSFTWPLFIYFGIIFIIFPFGKKIDFKSNNLASLLLSLGITFILFLDYFWLLDFQKVSMPEGTIQIWTGLLFLSIIFATLYIFKGVKTLLAGFGFPTVKSVFNLDFLIRLVLSIFLYIGVNYIFELFSSDAASTLSTFTFIQRVVLASVVRPFIYFISHVVYFGPIIVLILLLWRKICDRLKTFGLGVFLFLGLNLALSLNSESRTLIAAFPAFVIFLIFALGDIKLSYWFYWSFFLASIILSKVWISLGSVSFDGGYFRFPYQWYFMHYGPWISNQMYILQGLIVFVILFVFFILIKKDIERKLI